MLNWSNLCHMATSILCHLLWLPPNDGKVIYVGQWVDEEQCGPARIKCIVLQCSVQVLSVIVKIILITVTINRHPLSTSLGEKGSASCIPVLEIHKPWGLHQSVEMHEPCCLFSLKWSSLENANPNITLQFSCDNCVVTSETQATTTVTRDSSQRIATN